MDKLYKYNLPSKNRVQVGTHETIKLTRKCFKIVEEFADVAKKFAQGMLLTGSIAWGAHYAVTSTSDIDLLIVAKDVGILKKIIKKYIQIGFIQSFEQERFERFEKLVKNYPTCQFSLITKHRGVMVSVDFLTKASVEVICSMVPIGSIELNTDSGSLRLRTIKELRSNIPKISGYSLDSFKMEKKIIYHPKFEVVKNNKNKIVGYLSDTLIDGQRNDHNLSTYFLGVMSFFLLIYPIILFDKDKKLQRLIDRFRKNIGKMLMNESPIYITRQERMSPLVLEEIRKSLIICK
jgi:hypothetical protein